MPFETFVTSVAATVMRRGSAAPLKPGVWFGTPLQSGSKMEPHRCQMPVCAVTSVRGPIALGSLLVPDPYVSSHPCAGVGPAQRMEPAEQVQLLLIVRKACFAPEAPICSSRPPTMRYMFQTRKGCWSAL